MQLFNRIYEILIDGGAWLTILKGLGVTVQISALSLVLGTLLGALICGMRRTRTAILRVPARIYITVLRGSRC